MPSAEVTRPVIVIVDDDPNLRGSLATLLEANGFSSLTAQGSVEFFTLAEKHPIDLALVDLRLNGESGLALSIRIREHHRIPIVMLTGQGDETDRIIGLESSADDFIMKPFNPRELLPGCAPYCAARVTPRWQRRTAAPDRVNILAGSS